MNKFPKSAYVHIPFCHRRCFYCDFAVIPIGNEVETLKGYGSKTVQEYLQFLHKEILSVKHKSPLSSSAASDVYKRQVLFGLNNLNNVLPWVSANL